MSTKASLWAGSWYFLITVVSAGLLAWIPFVHAAGRLRRRSTAVWAVVYGAAAALLVTLLSLTPAEPQSGTAGDTFAMLAGLLLPCIVIAGCVQQAFLRREGYAPQPVAAPEPALAAALAARGRRTEARLIATQDPMLAHDLHIGRPDLPRSLRRRRAGRSQHGTRRGDRHGVRSVPGPRRTHRDGTGRVRRLHVGGGRVQPGRPADHHVGCHPRPESGAPSGVVKARPDPRSMATITATSHSTNAG